MEFLVALTSQPALNIARVDAVIYPAWSLSFAVDNFSEAVNSWPSVLFYTSVPTSDFRRVFVDTMTTSGDEGGASEVETTLVEADAAVVVAVAVLGATAMFNAAAVVVFVAVVDAAAVVLNDAAYAVLNAAVGVYDAVFVVVVAMLDAAAEVNPLLTSDSLGGRLQPSLLLQTISMVLSECRLPIGDQLGA